MKHKHTPGPWKVDPPECIFTTVDGEYIQVAEVADGWVNAFEVEPNARLIAAAPDLLEACQSLLNCEGAARIGAESGALQGLDWKYHFDKARAAIAKATGEDS